MARSILAVLVAGLATACSVSAPLAVDSSGAGSGRSAGIALALPDDGTQAHRARFGAALGQSFVARSFAIDPNGAFIADYAIAIGDASDGLLDGDLKPSTTEQEPDWITEPRRSRAFDKCEAQRMRGTLILFDRRSGELVYRGKASQIECEFTDADITAMADALVQDALDRSDL